MPKKNIISNTEAAYKIAALLYKDCDKSVQKIIDKIFKDALKKYDKNNTPSIVFNTLREALEITKHPYSNSAIEYWEDFFYDDLNALYNPKTKQYESDWQAVYRIINNILN